MYKQGALHFTTTTSISPASDANVTMRPSALPPLCLCALCVVSLLGLLGYQMSQSPESADGVTPQPAATPAAPAEPPLPRENAVMVLGATGRVGRRVVRALLQSGRTVVAAVRSEEKALKVRGR
eukprot:366546-Chlamydomonas_euryale.AAC.3